MNSGAIAVNEPFRPFHFDPYKIYVNKAVLKRRAGATDFQAI